MTNFIERTLETLAFALLIAGAVGFWYVTPANATDYGIYCHYEDDGEGGTKLVCYNANTGHSY